MQDENLNIDSPAARRASPRLVVEAREAVGLVRPYMARIAAWQQEAAWLRGRFSAHQSSEAERREARARLEELQREAERAHGELMNKAPRGRLHSRVEDTSRALKRFADLVRRELQGA